MDFEIQQTPDRIKNEKVKHYLLSVNKKIPSNFEINNRALYLQTLGFKTFDALHLAFAEFGKVNVFLTTDDKLLKLAQRNSALLKISAYNIAFWLEGYLK